LAAAFEGKDLVKKFLTDPAPEIRGKAALTFSKIGRSQSFRPLAKIILSEDFHTRSYGEKTSFFKALGETGSKEAIPLLEQIINKRRWLKKAQWEEMRLCAVNTLKRMRASKE
jgi:HEAT repeat protein